MSSMEQIIGSTHPMRRPDVREHSLFHNHRAYEIYGFYIF
ncbi:MAG: hypothetical protein H6Q49_1040 [Deltaproteobacteria bacterium]|nr:hypothetical protein [Deltaproteobacteria bacterium]